MKKELAIRILLDGNARFAANKCIHPHTDFERRFKTLESQNPFALVIGCFDSRIPPELIFDQGIGDMFVLRSPGHVINKEIIGAAEYAVSYMKVPLIVVLGHENCAAIKTAINNIQTNTGMDEISETLRNNIGSIDLNSPNALDEASKKNVRSICSQLNSSSGILSNAVRQKKLEITGMYYHLKTGNAEIISDSTWVETSSKTFSCVFL